MPGPSKINQTANIPRGSPNMTRLFFHADSTTGLGQAATIGELAELLSSTAPVTTFVNETSMLANTTLAPGYLAYVQETNSIYLYNGPTADDIDHYTLLASGGGSGGGSAMSGHFIFDDDTTDADPGAGKVRLNTGAFDTATEIYLDALTVAAVNIGAVLSDMATGDEIRLQVSDDDDNNVVYEFTAIPVDNDGYWTLAVTHKQSAGSFFLHDEELVATVVLVGIAAEGINIDGGRADSIYNTIPGIDGGTP